MRTALAAQQLEFLISRDFSQIRRPLRFPQFYGGLVNNCIATLQPRKTIVHIDTCQLLEVTPVQALALLRSKNLVLCPPRVTCAIDAIRGQKAQDRVRS